MISQRLDLVLESILIKIKPGEKTYLNLQLLHSSLNKLSLRKRLKLKKKRSLLCLALNLSFLKKRLQFNSPRAFGRRQRNNQFLKNLSLNLASQKMRRLLSKRQAKRVREAKLLPSKLKAISIEYFALHLFDKLIDKMVTVVKDAAETRSRSSKISVAGS